MTRDRSGSLAVASHQSWLVGSGKGRGGYGGSMVVAWVCWDRFFGGAGRATAVIVGSAMLLMFGIAPYIPEASISACLTTANSAERPCRPGIHLDLRIMASKGAAKISSVCN